MLVGSRWTLGERGQRHQRDWQPYTLDKFQEIVIDRVRAAREAREMAQITEVGTKVRGGNRELPKEPKRTVHSGNT